MSAVIDTYIPPNSLEAEMCVLGSMLLSERAVEQVLEMLTEPDFYRPAHREVFKAMLQLAQDSRAIDIVTVSDELTARGKLSFVGGPEYMIQLAESVPSPSNAVDYARIVSDKSTLRKLEAAGHDIVKTVHDNESEVEQKIDKAEQLVFSVTSRQNRESFKHVRNIAKGFFAKVDQLYETGQPILGAPSGFYDLDKMTGGLYPSDLLILAARPAMGKTSLLLGLSVNVARQRQGAVAVFSLEMSGEQLVRRQLSLVSGVGMGVLKESNLSDSAYHKLADACEELYSLPLFIDDNSEVTPFEMRGKCRRLKAEHGLALVVVDYLQLMKGNRHTENRVQEISEIARSLKGLAKELEVPVLALSQLNRSVESREDKRPQLSDIRESGSIEAEADIVMFIYRDAYYKAKELTSETTDWDPDRVEEAEIIIAKHRNGPTGKIMLGFQPNYARFMNLKR